MVDSTAVRSVVSTVVRRVTNSVDEMAEMMVAMWEDSKAA